MKGMIGIDLGTTNCSLAYSNAEGQISQFAIPQRVEAHLEQESPLLPSFYYYPLTEENLSPQVGQYAQSRGKELPDRVISSAKSWLSHPAIDLRKAFLPLGDFEPKISPVEVSRAYLNHLKLSWEKKFPQESLSEKKVVVTVPASFDPSSRELVLEASPFQEVTLMEEPLAAFYAWLYKHQKNWRELLKVGDSVLVVDIGGGTTDFSLISVGQAGGELILERKAVGDHLLLGGDNIDLTLAYLAQEKLGQQLDAWQFQSLIHGCRAAKESLLGSQAGEFAEVIIPGRSSRLIGGTLSVRLARQEVMQSIVEGFFPLVPQDESIKEERRSGLAKLALPYVRDPRITAHLAKFLSQSSQSFPTAVLFNGGTMKSFPFQERILAQLAAWKGSPVQALPAPELDFGVSMGAAYYAWSRQNQGIRVHAGTSRSFFIGIEKPAPAVPGFAPPIDPVCIAPLGMEEGSEATLESTTFSLLLEESAYFRFFSSNTQAKIGEIHPLSTLTELHPIETVLRGEGKVENIEVKLQAKITELGMLELWCHSEKGQKWKLEFNTRDV